MNSKTNKYKSLKQTPHEIEKRIKRILAPYKIKCDEYVVLEILYQKGNQTDLSISEEVMNIRNRMASLIDRSEKEAGYIVSFFQRGIAQRLFKCLKYEKLLCC